MRKNMKLGGMCWCTHQFLRRHAGSGGGDRGCRFGTYRAAGQLETACLAPPSSSSLCLRLSALSLFPSSFSHSLSPLPSPSPYPPPLSASVARAPFPCASAAAGSRLASAAASASESPDSVVFLGCLSFRRRKAPGGAPCSPPAFIEVICTGA